MLYTLNRDLHDLECMCLRDYSFTNRPASPMQLRSATNAGWGFQHLHPFYSSLLSLLAGRGSFSIMPALCYESQLRWTSEMCWCLHSLWTEGMRGPIQDSLGPRISNRRQWRQVLQQYLDSGCIHDRLWVRVGRTYHRLIDILFTSVKEDFRKEQASPAKRVFLKVGSGGHMGTIDARPHRKS